jgi:hypothetical protein
MLEAISGVLGGVASGGFTALFGGITGVVGAWLRQKHDLAVMKLQSEEKGRDRLHELAVMDREAASAEKLALVHLDETTIAGELAAMGKSIEAEAAGATWSTPWMSKATGWAGKVVAVALGAVDVVRGLIRPALTLSLVLMTYQLWFDMSKQLGASFPTATASSVVVRVVDMILFLTCMAVGWWFGSRGSKHERRNQ